MLQMAYFERDHRPVTMDIGPVLNLEDVLGSKVCALASRVEPRDRQPRPALVFNPGQLPAAKPGGNGQIGRGSAQLTGGVATCRRRRNGRGARLASGHAVREGARHRERLRHPG